MSTSLISATNDLPTSSPDHLATATASSNPAQSLDDAVGATGRQKRILFDNIWQLLLLPFMTAMVLGVTVFFLYASFVQVTDLHQRIFSTAPPQLVGSIDIDVWDTPAAVPSSDALGAARLKMAAALESYALARRYHQANILLMSRIWLHYLGFVTGMILALVGAVFILGKLREKSTHLDTKTSTFSLALQSSSPGLILAVLGVALMVTTILVHHDITVNDQPLYATTTPGATAVEEVPPPLPPLLSEPSITTPSEVNQPEGNAQ
jgi:hypothetical protein